MSTTLERQLEELELIRCSVMPGEVLTFVDDHDRWLALLDRFSAERTIPADDDIPVLPISFKVWVEGHDLRVYVSLPVDYPEVSKLPNVAVKGTTISRAEQDRWTSLIRERLQEASDNEQPTYNLVALNLFPLLHEDAEKRSAEATSLSSVSLTDTPTSPEPLFHALFTSHHLVSPTKRRNMQSWTASLNISGFAKVGYPGVIYAYGPKDAVEDFVDRVKAMQWLALRLRFLDALPEEEQDASKAVERKWGELHKVGEVVEEMRRLGREKYVTELGIGTSGSE
ncbi:uncharacterized protein SCHCODRAFT_02593693 [Schizophyllum commune H4-8]|nr:uncharacterized protein SCHCODRAFT_02593693 [Schizophyllum commune H4-8]KAI5885279.1 hypothetical protein SCHCODRAFT_02593693 [Schizophyllum commune H4-8]